jgi:N utilization substance protein A
MYKLGFRSVDEVIDAPEAELASIPGLGGAENAARIKASAETAMEVLRQRRILEATSRAEPPTERERMLQVRGVGERTLALLISAGFHSVEDLYREADEDRLAIKTGLGLKKARQIKAGARAYVESEVTLFDAARAVATKKREAEAAAEAEVAAAAAAAEAEVAAAAAAAEAAAHPATDEVDEGWGEIAAKLEDKT